MEEPKFIVDTMLGTLAKWLRIFGFDTLYEAGMDDDSILAIANEQHRIILSRDRGLCGRKSDSMFIESTDLDTQIKMVLDFYSIDENKILSRCLECNAILEQVNKGAVPGDAVPREIKERHDEFWHCSSCGKYYWPGSHYDNMKKKANFFFRV